MTKPWSLQARKGFCFVVGQARPKQEKEQRKRSRHELVLTSAAGS